jgi:hypothetical protein
VTVAQLEVAQLEEWYRLPSPPAPARHDAAGVAMFGICMACAVFALVLHAPRGAY